jgi:hypothetical protein
MIGIPINIVAVNYAVFAIITCDVSVFYVKYCIKRENI